MVWGIYRSLWIVGLSMMAAFANGETPFEEGVHYRVYPPKVRQTASIEALAAKDPGRIQVVEFFSYACHWCAHMDPQVSAWYATKNARKVAFRRIPVIFRPTWRPLAKAYFVQEALQLTEKIHPALFSHVQAGNALSTDNAVRDFFIAQGVSAEDFDTHYQSFGLNQSLENVNHLMRAYQLNGVPLFVVNGQYRAYATDVSLAGGDAALFAVLDFLIEKEQSGNP